jgi:hypothetical protein
LRLESRVDWLALQGQHAEDAFMYPIQWLSLRKPMERLDTQCKLS